MAELHKIRRIPDIEALQFRKGRSCFSASFPVNIAAALEGTLVEARGDSFPTEGLY